MMGIYKDDPTKTPADQLRSAACVVIPDGVPVPAGLIEDRMDRGQYACLVHTGPYEGLPGAWMKMRTALAGASTVPPSELKTEICVPIE